MSKSRFNKILKYSHKNSKVQLPQVKGNNMVINYSRAKGETEKN